MEKNTFLLELDFLFVNVYFLVTRVPMWTCHKYVVLSAIEMHMMAMKTATPL